MNYIKAAFFLIISTNIYGQLDSIHIMYNDDDGIEVNCFYLGDHLYYLSSNAKLTDRKYAGLSSTEGQLCIRRTKSKLDTIEIKNIQNIFSNFTINKPRSKFLPRLNITSKEEFESDHVTSLIKLLSYHLYSKYSVPWTESEKIYLHNHSYIVASFETMTEDLEYDAINFVSDYDQSFYMTNQLDLAKFRVELDKGYDPLNSRKICLPNFIYLRKDDSGNNLIPEFLSNRIALLFKGSVVRTMYLKGNYLYVSKNLFQKVNGSKIRSLFMGQ